MQKCYLLGNKTIIIFQVADIADSKCRPANTILLQDTHGKSILKQQLMTINVDMDYEVPGR